MFDDNANIIRSIVPEICELFLADVRCFSQLEGVTLMQKMLLHDLSKQRMKGFVKDKKEFFVCFPSSSES